MNYEIVQEIKKSKLINDACDTIKELALEDYNEQIVYKYPLVAAYIHDGYYMANLIHKVGNYYVTLDNPIDSLDEYDVIYSLSFNSIVEYLKKHIYHDFDDDDKVINVKDITYKGGWQ